MNPILSKLKNTIVFGVLRRHEKTDRVQVENLSGEIHSGMIHPQEHGFQSKAPVGSVVLNNYCGGDRGFGATITIKGQSPIELDEGDSVVYNHAGSTIHLEGGVIKMQGDAFNGLIKIDDLTAKINALIVEIRNHNHGGSVPATPFTDFTKTDYENTKVVHG